MRGLILVSAVIALAALPASSQTMQAPVMGALSPIEVGVEPMMRLAGPLYAKLALANEMRIIGAARLATSHTRSPDVRATATAMVREHEGALRALLAIRSTASQVGSARAAAARDLAVLKGRAEMHFSEAQLGWQRHAWALHAGYAADGRDPALRRFAGAALIRAERDLRRLPMRPMPY